MASSKAPSQEVLEELCARFVLNAPEEDMESWERLLFLVEQAHWYYEDFIREKDLTLRSYGLKEFTALMFKRVPGLEHFAPMVGNIFAQFNAYKQDSLSLRWTVAASMTIPTMGAILLDPSMEKCLLVRGWSKAAGWGFPKGKISKEEADGACAAREVLEETGYDVSPLLVEEDFIEIHLKEQRNKLYIIQGVDMATPFAPIARNEIGGLAWHHVADLPSTKESANQAYQTDAGTRHKFYLVWPYMKQLKRWIKNKRRQMGAAGHPQANGGALPQGGKGKGKRKMTTVPQWATNAIKQQKAQDELRYTKPMGLAAVTEQQGPSAQADRADAAYDAPVTANEVMPGSRPAPVKHCQPATVTGSAWVTFAFDRQAILQCLEHHLSV